MTVKNWLLYSTAIVSAAIATPDVATAQQNLDLVLRRLERLEQENAELRKRVNRVEAKKGTTTNRPPVDDVPATQANAAYVPAPVKAPGVAFVRICSLEGDGFFYIPGTDACIKFGGYVRLQGVFNGSGDGIVRGASTMATQGLSDRVRTNDINYMARAVVSVDVRAPTPFGQLRGYVRLGAETITPSGSSLAPALFWDRGYIQFVGFTAGKAQSFFDLFTLSGRYTYGNLRTTGDTALNGAALIGYTQRFGSGVSASVSIEDPGAHWKVGVVDATQGAFGIGTITANNGLGLQSATANGMRWPDAIANLRVDRPWGFIGVSGVLHSVAGAYYGTADQTANGSPNSKLGWAVSVGGKANVPNTAGDTFGVNVVYTQGAVGYALRGERWSILRPGKSIGLGWAVDGIFDGPNAATGTPIHLTQAWSINAAYERVWNTAWRTSVYGGYARVDYGGAATRIVNSHLPGAAGTAPCGVPVAGAVFPPLGIAVGDPNSCNPDFSFVQVGSRTQYNPVTWLDLGIDVTYTRLFTAYKGAATGGVQTGNPQGAVFGLDDQHILSVMGRAQLNFLP